MENTLEAVEIRVLGTLIEKENTTPEYYPLTLNSLMLACNQKTNRWPVTEYDEGEVQYGLDHLRRRGFAVSITGGSRAVKYAQRYTEKLNLGRRETAILCVLLLRGQQTVGEIKGRCERMYSFADLEETEMVLQKLMERAEGPLVQKLAASPGMKEPRFAQTLGGPVEAQSLPAPSSRGSGEERFALIEAELSRLAREVAELRQRLEEVL